MVKPINQRFLAVQYAVSLSGPLFFVGLRFATAALAVGLLSLRTLRGLTWLEVKAGVAIGVAIALGYGLQTWGLQTISSSKSAFITAMYVPLVPLLQWLCLGRMPGVMSCVGIVLAFIGLILLAGPENNLLALGVGEMITLASAVAIAAEIILISAWAGKVDVRRVTVVQLATASLVAFAAMKPAGESVPSLTPALLGVALERVAYRPLRKANRLAAVVSALGASIVFQNAVMLIYGARVYVYPDFLRPDFTVHLFGLSIPGMRILIIVSCVVLMVVHVYPL